MLESNRSLLSVSFENVELEQSLWIVSPDLLTRDCVAFVDIPFAA